MKLIDNNEIRRIRDLILDIWMIEECEFVWTLAYNIYDGKISMQEADDFILAYREVMNNERL